MEYNVINMDIRRTMQTWRRLVKLAGQITRLMKKSTVRETKVFAQNNPKMTNELVGSHEEGRIKCINSH